jgi:hypothetical protein
MPDESTEFMECDTCLAKPGTPLLCAGCLHNREAIAILSRHLRPDEATIKAIAFDIRRRICPFGGAGLPDQAELEQMIRSHLSASEGTPLTYTPRPDQWHAVTMDLAKTSIELLDGDGRSAHIDFQTILNGGLYLCIDVTPDPPAPEPIADKLPVIDGEACYIDRLLHKEAWYIHNGEWDEDARFIGRDGKWQNHAHYWTTQADAIEFLRTLAAKKGVTQ